MENKEFLEDFLIITGKNNVPDIRYRPFNFQAGDWVRFDFWPGAKFVIQHHDPVTGLVLARRLRTTTGRIGRPNIIRCLAKHLILISKTSDRRIFNYQG
jgi:hypothetical protein